MSRITAKQLLTYLTNNGISFSIEGTLEEETVFSYASIFEPIQRGFYFYLGAKMAFPIERSLLLAHQEVPMSDSGNENTVIYINANPQTTYYRILQEFHGEQSTGIISPHAVIDPEAEIGENVQIDPFCVIGKVKIGANTIIKSHCTLHDNTVIHSDVHIESGSVIGARGVAWIWNESETEKVIQPQIGGVTVGERSFLGAHTVVVRGSINEHTRIGHDSLLAPGSRIGHGTQIGNFVHFANNVITGGNTKIADYCFVGSSAVFRPKVKLHPETIVGAGAVVTKDTTKEGATLVGVPAKQLETKAHPSGMPKPKSKK
jgi:UDP-3-O-[3-hydroxymyristoyl] glucosamine N-acyltransferase